MEVGVSGVTIGPNVARHVDWEYGHVSGSATILSLNMVVDRVMKKNVKMLNTAENGCANQVWSLFYFFPRFITFSLLFFQNSN